MPYETSEVGIIPSGYPYNTISGYGINPSQTNRNIKPEFVSTADLNVQLGFLKDRITLEGSVYQSDTENLITNANVSNTSGLNTLRDNVGKTRMRGFEVDLGLTPIKSAGIVWNIRASYAMSRSKVLELPEGVAEVNIYTPYSNRGIGVYAVLGEDFPILKGTTFQRDDQGRIIVDSNGTPLLSTELTNLGRVTPDYTLTLNTSVKFKGFTLSGSIDYRKGGVFSTLTKSLLTFTGAAEETGDFDRSQGYIVPNSVQLVNGGYVTNSTPVGGSASYANIANYFTSSTLQSLGEPTVIDATAFKVREISLSYDIPKNVLATTFVNSLTIKLYSRNPFIVYAKENRNYSDPETALSNGNGFGIAGTGQYPTQRSFGVNLKASF